MNRKEKVIRCIDCVHCNAKEMKCFPKSEDCEKEYDLTEQDLYTKDICDFAEYK